MIRFALIIGSLLLTVNLKSQATSEVEFNYLKKGIQTMDNEGLDTKKGYTLTDIASEKYAAYQLTVRKLTRDKDGSLAGISIKVFEPGFLGVGTKYYAIPAPSFKTQDSFGWPQFHEEIRLMDGGIKTVILQWMSYKYSVLISKENLYNPFK
jgi:hypothetical protein